MRSFRRTLSFLAPYRGRVILAVIATLLVTVLQIVPPRLYQAAIDFAIQPTIDARHRLAETGLSSTQRLRLSDAVAHGPTVLMWIAIAMISVIVVRNVLSYVNSYTVTWIGHRFVFDLRFATWKHLQRLSLAYHNQTQTGKLMARATADIELIQALIQGQLVTFISDIVTLVAVMVMLFFMEWRIALVIFALVPFYVMSYLGFLKHIRLISNEQRKYYDEMLGKLAEKISGIQVVKAFVRESFERDSFMSSVRLKFNADMRQVHMNRRLGLISGVISSIGRGVVYAYGGYLVIHGQMTAGKLVAMTFYIGFIFDPAVRVVDFNNTLQWAVTAMDRVFQTLDTRPEIEDAPSSLALPPLKGEVRFDHVSFSYKAGVEVLDDVDLTIRAGEVVALVGASGAGKSTLMYLLMRFYDPTRGSVRVDGYDLKDIRLDSHRRQISMVAQENILFSVSILENIRYGNRDASEDEAIAAAKAADLHDFIMDLPDGYETMIGENGIKLSGGQKQRLALARALVTDPKILILDDVTSALDGETEARVQDALKVIMRGRTTFIIAHRLSSVVDADRILVLDNGRVAEQGTHTELVERGDIYAAMYREQFKSALEAIA